MFQPSCFYEFSKKFSLLLIQLLNLMSFQFLELVSGSNLNLLSCGLNLFMLIRFKKN
jgi:hypothetical protein